MEILPEEVESVKVLGKLFDNDVKMVKTFGGFHLAVGKKHKNSSKAEAITGGSHPAIVAHQLAKQYGSDFVPALFKSEQDQLDQLEDNSQFLSSDMLKNGIELYTLHKNNEYKFVLYKNGVTLGLYKADLDNQEMVIKAKFFKSEIKTYKEDSAKALAKALNRVVYSKKLKGIVDQTNE